MVGHYAFLFQCFCNIIANGAYLARVLSGANNKIVRETASFTDIQQYYIRRLLIRSCVNGFTG